MATSVRGMKVSTAVLDAMTSCTNSMPSHWDSSRPPEPVMAMVMASSGNWAAASRSTSMMVARASAWCRRYTAQRTSPAASSTASFTVVEPTSMPMRRAFGSTGAGATPAAAVSPTSPAASTRVTRMTAGSTAPSLVICTYLLVFVRFMVSLTLPCSR